MNETTKLETWADLSTAEELTRCYSVTGLQEFIARHHPQWKLIAAEADKHIFPLAEDEEKEKASETHGAVVSLEDVEGVLLAAEVHAILGRS
jgi:hypothetical protein